VALVKHFPNSLNKQSKLPKLDVLRIFLWGYAPHSQQLKLTQGSFPLGSASFFPELSLVVDAPWGVSKSFLIAPYYERI